MRARQPEPEARARKESQSQKPERETRDGRQKEQLPPLRLDVANAQAWQGEQLLMLTPKAFAVLQYLLAHMGQLVTKEELLQTVWAGTVVTNGALVACI